MRHRMTAIRARNLGNKSKRGRPVDYERAASAIPILLAAAKEPLRRDRRDPRTVPLAEALKVGLHSLLESSGTYTRRGGERKTPGSFRSAGVATAIAELDPENHDYLYERLMEERPGGPWGYELLERVARGCPAARAQRDPAGWARRLAAKADNWRKLYEQVDKDPEMVVARVQEGLRTAVPDDAVCRSCGGIDGLFPCTTIKVTDSSWENVISRDGFLCSSCWGAEPGAVPVGSELRPCPPPGDQPKDHSSK